jgi:hypothetical protein
MYFANRQQTGRLLVVGRQEDAVVALRLDAWRCVIAAEELQVAVDSRAQDFMQMKAPIEFDLLKSLMALREWLGSSPRPNGAIFGDLTGPTQDDDHLLLLTDIAQRVARMLENLEQAAKAAGRPSCTGIPFPERGIFGSGAKLRWWAGRAQHNIRWLNNPERPAIEARLKAEQTERWATQREQRAASERGQKNCRISDSAIWLATAAGSGVVGSVAYEGLKEGVKRMGVRKAKTPSAEEELEAAKTAAREHLVERFAVHLGATGDTLAVTPHAEESRDDGSWTFTFGSESGDEYTVSLGPKRRLGGWLESVYSTKRVERRRT